MILLYFVLFGVVNFIHISNENTFEGNEDTGRILIPLRKGIKILIPLFFVLSIFLLFCPSTKQIAALYVVPKIVNNETFQEDSKELYNMAIEGLKETLEKEDKEILEIEDNG
jgi:hypothetical protein